MKNRKSKKKFLKRSEKYSANIKGAKLDLKKGLGNKLSSFEKMLQVPE